MSTKTVNISAPYRFTDDELKDLGLGLAEKCSKKHEVEAEKKTVMSDFKDKLGGMQSEIDEITQKLNDGEESRVYECTKEKDYEKNKISYLAVEGGALIKEVEMTAEDHQTSIDDPEIKSDNVSPDQAEGLLTETNPNEEQNPENHPKPNPEEAPE